MSGSLWPPVSAWALPGSPQWGSCVCELFNWGTSGIFMSNPDGDPIFPMLGLPSMWVEMVQLSKCVQRGVAVVM